MLGPFLIGTKPTLQVQCLDANNAPLTPTNIYFTYTRPGDATPTTWHFGDTGSIVEVSTGKFTAKAPYDVSGEWLVRWATTGNLELSWEEVVMITSSTLSPPAP